MQKIRNWPTYTGYLIVIVISFVVALLPVNEVLKYITAIPGIGSIFLFLNQLLRDQLAHDRAIELQNKQQDFLLGTASHMSDVVYDKHVVFCETYINRVQDGLQELLRDGPSKISLGKLKRFSSSSCH